MPFLYILGVTEDLKAERTCAEIEESNPSLYSFQSSESSKVTILAGSVLELQRSAASQTDNWLSFLSHKQVGQFAIARILPINNIGRFLTEFLYSLQHL